MATPCRHVCHLEKARVQLPRPPAAIQVSEGSYKSQQFGGSPYSLPLAYTQHWRTFRDDVSTALTQIDRNSQVPNVSAFDKTSDRHLVANKDGLYAKFLANIATPLNMCLEHIPDLKDCRFADFHATFMYRPSRSEPERKLVPDFSIVDAHGALHSTKPMIVSEMKTFWTFNMELADIDPAVAISSYLAVLENPLGQLTAHMNTQKLKFGFLTTYEHTIFVRRDDQLMFSISSPFPHTAKYPSLREAMLYLIWAAKTQGAAFNSKYSTSQLCHSLIPEPVSDCSSSSEFSYDAIETGGIEERFCPAASGGQAETEAVTTSLKGVQLSDTFKTSHKTLLPSTTITAKIHKCDILNTLCERDERAVYKCLWQGQNLLLKWWDAADEFAQLSFRKKNIVHRDAQPNVLWDSATQTMSVIDWEIMRIQTDMPPPEDFEIHMVMVFCDERSAHKQ
ncbi:hypothetical protein H072_3500 [Dactylellina haptotyla CBS 200.50]|uniref:Uncharacterized protein n=1 Tax=Dactylellina haptotyla (strain CBS 200.50) TaxID=1284197 RepID=S8BSQ4_DACHA|nr:hypothetical protein H072_3500 [Dactylellina haptotyla CBS 200.50]